MFGEHPRQAVNNTPKTHNPNNIAPTFIDLINKYRIFDPNQFFEYKTFCKKLDKIRRQTDAPDQLISDIENVIRVSDESAKILNIKLFQIYIIENKIKLKKNSQSLWIRALERVSQKLYETDKNTIDSITQELSQFSADSKSILERKIEIRTHVSKAIRWSCYLAVSVFALNPSLEKLNDQSNFNFLMAKDAQNTFNYEPVDDKISLYQHGVPGLELNWEPNINPQLAQQLENFQAKNEIIFKVKQIYNNTGIKIDFPKKGDNQAKILRINNATDLEKLRQLLTNISFLAEIINKTGIQFNQIYLFDSFDEVIDAGEGNPRSNVGAFAKGENKELYFGLNNDIETLVHEMAHADLPNSIISSYFFTHYLLNGTAPNSFPGITEADKYLQSTIKQLPLVDLETYAAEGDRNLEWTSVGSEALIKENYNSYNLQRQSNLILGIWGYYYPQFQTNQMRKIFNCLRNLQDLQKSGTATDSELRSAEDQVRSAITSYKLSLTHHTLSIDTEVVKISNEFQSFINNSDRSLINPDKFKNESKSQETIRIVNIFLAGIEAIILTFNTLMGVINYIEYRDLTKSKD